jgi:hypothetical protein
LPAGRRREVATAGRARRRRTTLAAAAPVDLQVSDRDARRGDRGARRVAGNSDAVWIASTPTVFSTVTVVLFVVFT